MNESTKKPNVEFYGGKIGGWIPIFSLVAGILCLTIAGKGGVQMFWLAAYLGLCVGFILCKDKKEFHNMCVDAISDPLLATVILAFLLAGILSQILRQSGLINSLLWLASEMNLNVGFIPVVVFLTSVLISTACGTCSGTVSTVTPVMFPFAVSLGCNPALIMGAIISGSYFGDNLAPISDTTIVSALTNEAEVTDCVMSRLPYSLIAGGIASVLYIFFGLQTATAPSEGLVIDPMYSSTLVMLVLPVAMVVLSLILRNLTATLLICNFAGIILNLVFGFVPADKMFSSSGPIIAGMAGMLNVITFCLLLFMVMETTKRSGTFDMMIDFAVKHCKNPRQAEIMCAALGSGSAFLTAQNTSCICIMGPVVRSILKPFGIERTRGANIIDSFCVALTGLIPYGISLMMLYGLAVDTGLVPEGMSSAAMVPYSFHCIMLVVVYLVSMITGIGRKFEDPEAAAKYGGKLSKK